MVLVETGDEEVQIMEAAVLMRRIFELETWGDHQDKQKSQNAADETEKNGKSTCSQASRRIQEPPRLDSIPP